MTSYKHPNSPYANSVPSLVALDLYKLVKQSPKSQQYTKISFKKLKFLENRYHAHTRKNQTPSTMACAEGSLQKSDQKTKKSIPQLDFKIDNKIKLQEPLGVIRATVDPNFNLDSEERGVKVTGRGKNAMAKLGSTGNFLDLSLSAIKQEPDQNFHKFANTSRTLENLFDFGQQRKYLERLEKDICPQEQPESPGALIDVDVSIIRPARQAKDETEIQSIEVLMENSLDITFICFENDMSNLDKPEDFIIPDELKDVDLSDIEIQNKGHEDESCMNEIQGLLTQEFSLEIELSMIQSHQITDSCSDIKALVTDFELF